MLPSGLQEIRAEKTGMQVSVQCNAHISGRVYKSLPVITDNRLRVQELPPHLRVQFDQQRITALQQKADIARKKPFCLPDRKAGAAFGTKPAFFYCVTVKINPLLCRGRADL